MKIIVGQRRIATLIIIVIGIDIWAAFLWFAQFLYRIGFVLFNFAGWTPTDYFAFAAIIITLMCFYLTFIFWFKKRIEEFQLKQTASYLGLEVNSLKDFIKQAEGELAELKEEEELFKNNIIENVTKT